MRTKETKKEMKEEMMEKMVKMEKRPCWICGANLSIYNRSDRCFHHRVWVPEKDLQKITREIKKGLPKKEKTNPSSFENPGE